MRTNTGRSSLPSGCILSHDPAVSISDLLLNGQGRSVVRVGGIEAHATYRLLISGDVSDSLMSKLRVNAGFYPRSRNELFKFAFENCLALSNSTITAYWESKLPRELFEFLNLKKTIIPLNSLEPITSYSNWLSSIKQSVCVVSPFVETMKKQLECLDKLHQDVDLYQIFLGLKD